MNEIDKATKTVWTGAELQNFLEEAMLETLKKTEERYGDLPISAIWKAIVRARAKRDLVNIDQATKVVQ